MAQLTSTANQKRKKPGLVWFAEMSWREIQGLAFCHTNRNKSAKINSRAF